MGKTLVFGGAFDPPHKEHVNMCVNAMKELGCDRLVIVPTVDPPHKNKGFLSFDERCILINKAFYGINFVIDDIEKIRGKDNYTCLVLPLLKEKYGDIVFLIGGDSFEYFNTWYHPEIIVKTAQIAVCGREGYTSLEITKEKLVSEIGGDFIILDYKGQDISSSMIKAKLLMLEECNELSEEVINAVKEHHFYEDYKWMVEKLKTYQTEDLFNHSKAVVKRSVDFNSKHNLKQDFNKVFLAALLHDNAKQRPSLDGFDVPADAVGTKVLHQFLGAEKAKRDFEINDEDILNAIKYHTTAKNDMTMLEKLIYTGDSLSDDRDYGEIPRLREIAVNNFDEGFRAVLKHTYEKLIAEGRAVYPLTLSAVEYYL